MGYAEAGQFRKIKNPQCAVPDMLRAVCDGGVVREALLWNTCRRFEFYGWLNTTTDDTERARTILDVRRRLFDANGHTDVSIVNILQGADAWLYLMRTAAGLNSGLPGEREVLQQLHGARRLAERAGTAGPLMNRLVNDVSTCEQNLREQTEWGRFSPDYCHASISQVVRSAELDLADCRCVVIGGSTTSCSILAVLTGRFGVPRRQLTLLHRGHSHGGHLKMLRRAIGNGRRIRVHKYDEESVIRAIADADVVLFGLDRKEPVLDAEQIRDCRDFTDRPLAVIDFNMFGSTAGMEALDGVRVWDAEDLEDAVAAFAEDMCRSEEFTQAVEAAELWIRDRVPRPLAATGAHS
jgi:glutamyl-tRNA reductase